MHMYMCMYTTKCTSASAESRPLASHAAPELASRRASLVSHRHARSTMPPSRRVPSTRALTSHRSGEDSQRNPPKSQRGSSKAKPKAKEPVARHEAAEPQLKPMAEVLAPLLAAVDKLRSEIDELESQLASKSMGSSTSLLAPTAPAAAVASSAAATTTTTTGGEADARQKRTKALRVWQNFASDQLTAMASSLEAALASDEKLRRLFDKIDIDLGGTIDQQELQNALRAAGKNVTTEAVAEMFRAADYDGGKRPRRVALSALRHTVRHQCTACLCSTPVYSASTVLQTASRLMSSFPHLPACILRCTARAIRPAGGDIDYSEFADVIKGMKASKAAFILERGVRRHQEAKKPKTVSQTRARPREARSPRF